MRLTVILLLAIGAWAAVAALVMSSELRIVTLALLALALLVRVLARRSA